MNTELSNKQDLTTGTGFTYHQNPKNRRKRIFKVFFNIVVAALLRAVALELFLFPNKVLIGGAVGVAGTLSWIFDAPVLTGLFLLIVNIPLLVIAFFKTDRNFVYKTTACLVLMVLFMELFSIFDLAGILGTADISGENKVLFALIGGALSGISLPLALSVQASTGGSDIVTMILQKTKGIGNHWRATVYIDICTILIAAGLSQWVLGAKDGMDVMIYSVAAQFVANLVQNQIYKGYSTAYGFDIITDKPQEVAQALSENLRRGITGIKVTGMYSHQDKTMIVCVIYKRQLNKARQLVRQVDPNAFATVYTVKEVVGNGFRNTEEDIEDKILHSDKK